MSEALASDLFGFSDHPARAERAAPAAPKRRAAPVAALVPIVAVAPPPVAPVVALQTPRMPMPASSASQDVPDVADSPTVVVASVLQGWTLSSPSGAYSGATTQQAIRWVVGALRTAGYLRDRPEPTAAATPLLGVHAPVACMLEVYQLLALMVAAAQAGQVTAATDHDPAALAGWLQSAERTLRQHRAVALARGEQHV